MQHKDNSAGATSPAPVKPTGQPPRLLRARKERMPQAAEQRREKFEVIAGSGEKPTPPSNTPAGAVWVPRDDREAIIVAFQHRRMKIHVLSSRQHRKYNTIESVIRERLHEQDARIRMLETELRQRVQMHIARRDAA